jgi:DNA invertase Pin-like site-specific DNA recombinase
MNGVIYCRVSSKEQVDGTSLESQEAACRDYARRNGMAVSRVFVERGESAKFADRTQLLELLEFCRRKESLIGALLVWKIDRLARNVGDHFNIKANLLKQNIRVVSVTEPIDTNPEGKLLETILAGFAQFDNDLRAARTVQGMKKKIQDGIFPWKPPLGYRTPTPAGSKKTQPDEPDQPTFSLLQGIWHAFATGSYTKAEILRLATARGVRTKAGWPLSKQSIDNMFRDVFYSGMVKDPWSGEEHTGGHLPLVSREVFARVQQMVAKRANSQRHESLRPEFPLRGFARCTECNYYVTGAFCRGRSKRYPYYHCFRRMCSRRMYCRTEVVHQEFTDYLHLITPRARSMGVLAEALAESMRNRSDVGRGLEERKRREGRRLVEQQKRLVRMKVENLITDEEFLAQREILSQRQLELDNLPFLTDKNREETIAGLKSVSEQLHDLPGTWNALSPALQRRFQRAVLPAGFVAGQIRTADMSCLFSLFQGSKASESHLVPPTGQFWNQIARDIHVLSLILQEDQVAAVTA